MGLVVGGAQRRLLSTSVGQMLGRESKQWSPSTVSTLLRSPSAPSWPQLFCTQSPVHSVVSRTHCSPLCDGSVHGLTVLP